MNLGDEDEDEIKEIEKLNKDIVNKLKIEMAINENLEEAEKFVKQNTWKTLIDKTYYIKQNIERIWDATKTLDFIFNPNNSIDNQFIIKRGANIWNIGNIFEGKLFNNYEFNSKVIKLKLHSDFKTIEWIFFLGTGDNFRLKLNLYKVTDENTTVLNIKMKSIPLKEDNIVNQIKEKITENNCDKSINEIINKDKVFFYQYESGIIEANMEDIWDIVIDHSKVALIAPNNRCFVPVNINNLKVGEITNIPMRIKSVEGFLELKLDLKENKKGRNDWAYGYSILGGGPFRTAKQTFFVKLTKINKQETQLCLFTKIYEKVPLEMCKYLSQQKKYVISSIRDYFENFSAANKDVNN